MKNVKFLIKLLTFFMLCFILCKCNSPEDTSYKYLKYTDEFMRIPKSELEKKIELLDQEILEIIRQVNILKKEKNAEEDNLNLDTTKINTTLINLKENRNKAVADTMKLRNDIKAKKKELDNFVSHNEFQIERDRLQRRKDQVSRFINDLKQMESLTTDINMIIVETKLQQLKEDFQKLKVNPPKFSPADSNQEKNKKILKTLIDKLHLIESNIDSTIRLKVEEYQDKLEVIRNEIKNYQNRLFKLKNNIKNYDVRIADNEKLKLSSIDDSKDKIKDYETSINFFTRRKYEKINEKYVYEITLITKNLSDPKYKSGFLSDQVKELKALQLELVEKLAVEDYNYADKLIEDLKNALPELSQTIADAITIEAVIKDLFKNGFFIDYMNLGTIEDANDRQVQKYIDTFHAHRYTLKKFLEFYPEYQIYIDGHADRSEYSEKKGPYENTKLSKDRAFEVRRLMLISGIDFNKIIVDYYGKFHNLTPCQDFKPDELDTVINRRADIRIIPIADSLKTKKDLAYLKFKNNFNVQIDKINQWIFKHENGFWIQHGYDLIISKIDSIFFEDEVYDSLLKRNVEFKKLMSDLISPIYHKNLECKQNGCLRLGNQVRLILSINGKDYKIEICEEGAKTIDEIKNEEFKNYLLGIQPIAQK